MAPDTGPITATSAALVRLLSAGPARVSLDDGALRFEDGRGAAASTTPVGAIDRVETRRSWFWTRLAIREAGGAERAIGGLDRREAERIAEGIREDAARAAETLAPLLTRLDSRLSRFHATDRYIRKSLSNGLQADIATAVQQCGGSLARAHLPPRAAEALSRVERVARLDAFEAAREEANSRFVAARAPAVVGAASGVLSSPPTGEQAAAIATDEDTTLVLAGAGTGKTAVITAKVAHLVRNQGVPADEILVLAFNRKAAEEIRERLPDDLAGAHVATFHAFGRRVIADRRGRAEHVEAGRGRGEAHRRRRPDPRRARQRSAAEQGGHELHHQPARGLPLAVRLRDARRVLRLHPPLRVADADRRSREELRGTGDRELPHAQRRQLHVRSALRGRVRHLVEPPVPACDFYLPDHGIYIEHFAYWTGWGRSPPEWTGYAEGVEWKRGIHEQYGTNWLIETYSWQLREGVLRETLRAQLEEFRASASSASHCGRCSSGWAAG